MLSSQVFIPFFEVSNTLQEVELAARPFAIMMKDEIEHLEITPSEGSDNAVRTVLLFYSSDVLIRCHRNTTRRHRELMRSLS